jgi:hypothetical protein
MRYFGSDSRYPPRNEEESFGSLFLLCRAREGAVLLDRPVCHTGGAGAGEVISLSRPIALYV